MANPTRDHSSLPESALASQLRFPTAAVDVTQSGGFPLSIAHIAEFLVKTDRSGTHVRKLVTQQRRCLLPESTNRGSARLQQQEFKALAGSIRYAGRAGFMQDACRAIANASKRQNAVAKSGAPSIAAAANMCSFHLKPGRSDHRALQQPSRTIAEIASAAPEKSFRVKRFFRSRSAARKP